MADFQSRMFSITFDDDDNARAITYHQQHFTSLSVIYETMNTIPLLDQYHLPTDTNDTSIIIIRDQDNTFKYSAPAHTPLSTIFNWHDPTANHLYLYDDLILSGVQPLSTYTDDKHILFLDALQELT